ncbi:MAG: ATP synthase F1 subunit gamma [Candidatus Wildermuthbacteria bacterium]|nr:ATP synthase F1 subunit gamma [Candidatus Wildermuthbacteria bacterium]
MISKRQLKSKIHSIGNIRQMTRAMELVAATKMRKAQDRALRSRPYAAHALSLLSRIVGLARAQEQEGTLFSQRERGKVCLVVVTSDKGLSGSFNNAVLRTSWQLFEGFIREKEEVEIIAVGKKSRDFFVNRNAAVAASFLRFSDIITLEDVAPLINRVLHSYEEKTYKKVVFCSTHFVSALLNKAEAHQVLPLSQKELLDIAGPDASLEKQQGSLLEPSSEEVFETLSKELVRALVLHLLFESNAAEHSSRMIAMKNATENAKDILETLTLDLNKARQSSITQELSEVTSAKEALTTA